VGIPPQHLQRLTERFYRVDVGRSREAGGTGLGLSIVKHILEQYRAQLDISSTPGAGSTFGFTLAREHLCELGPQACNA
jgi:two-component system phosphate regulon sensor histidine kinase PhoR